MQTQSQDPTLLLDWSTPFDQNKLANLENVVHVMYQGTTQNRAMANDILNQFKQYPDSWTVVDFILEKASNPNTKFFALQILDEAVNTRWQILPEEHKKGVRVFIINLVLKFSEDETVAQQNQHVLTKLNATLISIVKQEWTISWQNFVPDICSNAKESQARCENALNILKLLSEEVFDFSKNTLLSQQASKLKEIMTNDFQHIFQLCTWVLDQAANNPQTIKPTLVRSCLKTFQAFLSWIPFAYIFDTELIPIIINNFLAPTSSRIEAIKCFSEIASLNLEGSDPTEQRSIKEKLCYYFCLFIQKIAEVTKNRNLVDEYKNVQGSKTQTGFENFARQAAMAIIAVYKNNIDLIEETTNTAEPNQNILFLQQCVQKALEIMVQLSSIPEDELFKICLDFWHFFCYNVMMKTKGTQYFHNFAGMNFGSLLSNSFMHYQIYPPILEHVRLLMIDQMAKPKEVLVVIDENGEAVEEVFDDTETISIYETMRETLIYLTNIDTPAMDRVIQARLDRITGDKQFFTFDRLNKLCWALGSISGCMLIDEENKFVVSVIKELLNLCEKTSGKSNKALVAADIMYVVGQFPRFLTGHWAFLKTVIKKLNEFMHEKHPGVQDMASETFLKISKQTKHMFTMKHDSEKEPYVNDLIRFIPEHLKDLEAHQKLMVYEGIGHMISTEPNPMVQEKLVNDVLQYADFEWNEILRIANQNTDQLMLPEVLKAIDFTIKINTRIAESVGFLYLSYLRKIFNDLLKMYGLYSQCISQQFKFRQQEHMIKPMKLVRRDILKLIQTYIERSNEFTIFNQEFLPTLQNLVEDYQQSEPNSRDPEVLMLFATLLKKQGDMLTGFLQQILYNLCESTLAMIKDDYISFPEFREGCFKLVENIVKHCTAGLFQLPSEKFQTLILTILFAMKHEKPELMEVGLVTMHALNELVISEPSIANIFYQNFYILIIRDTLTLMTDYRHMSGFKLQGMILQQLLTVVDTESLQAKINDQAGQPHPCSNNKEYVIHVLIDCIKSLFPNLNKVQIEAFVWNLFNFCQDWASLKGTFRDLLISMKSFSSNDDDFYEEERKTALEESKKKEQLKRSAIPGLLRPSEQATLGGNGCIQ